MLLDILFFCPTLFHFFFLHELFFIQRVWIFFLLNCTLKNFYNVLKRIYQINWKLAFLCIFPFSYISLHHFYLSLFCSPSECHKALGRFAEATFIPFYILVFSFLDKASSWWLWYPNQHAESVSKFCKYCCWVSCSWREGDGQRTKMFWSDFA